MLKKKAQYLYWHPIYFPFRILCWSEFVVTQLKQIIIKIKNKIDTWHHFTILFFIMLVLYFISFFFWWQVATSTPVYYQIENHTLLSMTTETPNQQQKPCKWTCELTNDRGYVVYSALGSFYIPMFVMLFFYWRIYRAAVRTTRAINQGFKTTKGKKMWIHLFLRIFISIGEKYKWHWHMFFLIMRDEATYVARISLFANKCIWRTFIQNK